MSGKDALTHLLEFAQMVDKLRELDARARMDVLEQTAALANRIHDRMEAKPATAKIVDAIGKLSTKAAQKALQ